MVFFYIHWLQQSTNCIGRYTTHGWYGYLCFTMHIHDGERISKRMMDVSFPINFSFLSSKWPVTKNRIKGWTSDHQKNWDQVSLPVIWSMGFIYLPPLDGLFFMVSQCWYKYTDVPWNPMGSWVSFSSIREFEVLGVFSPQNAISHSPPETCPISLRNTPSSR